MALRKVSGLGAAEGEALGMDRARNLGPQALCPDSDTTRLKGWKAVSEFQFTPQ